MKLSGIGAVGISVSFLLQSLPIPDGISDFLGTMPVVGILIWLMLNNNRERKEESERSREYLEHMLELQDSRHNSAYEVQKSLIDKLIDKIESLTNQVAINTATVHEATAIDEILKQIIDDRLD